MEKWDNKIKFIFTTLGCSIGFGSVWRFSYNLYSNGGGIFLFLNIIFLIIIGIPYTYWEIIIGQYYKKNIFSLYNDINRKYWGLGFNQLILTFFICLNFASILSFCLIYIKVALFNYTLPFYSINKNEIIYKTHEFFYKQILELKNINDNDSIFGSISMQKLIALILIWIIIYFIIYKGINNSGKIAIITVSIPYVLFFILFIKGLLLPGSSHGLKELFIPDFSKLWDYKLWINSISQVIFQLSLGFQVNIFFSSLRKTKDKSVQVTYILTLSNFFTGIFFGIIIYLFWGYYSQLLNISIKDLPLSGPDLVFITIPSILNLFYYPNFWLILFSISFILVGIDSIFSSFDCFYYSLENYLKINNFLPKFCSLNIKIKKLIIVILIFLLSIPISTEKGFYLFLAIDNFIFPTLSLFSIIYTLIVFIKNKYVIDKIMNYLSSKSNENIPSYFKFCLKKIQLPILLILFIFQLIYIFFANHNFGKFVYIVNIVLIISFIINFYFLFRFSNNKSQFHKKEKLLSIKEILLNNK